MLRFPHYHRISLRVSENKNDHSSFNRTIVDEITYCLYQVFDGLLGRENNMVG